MSPRRSRRPLRWMWPPALLIAGLAQARPPLPPVPPPAPAAATLTLVTLDLGPDREHWATARAGVLARLGELRPDVIALQNVLQTPELPNQACWLAGQLGYRCHFITADPPSRPRREGNALLTRRRIIEDAVTVLHPTQMATTAGLLRLDIDGTAVNVYVTQLSRDDGADPTLRTRQVHNLLRWMGATAEDAPSIVAGDLGAAGTRQDLAELTASYRDQDASADPARAGADVASSALVLPGPTAATGERILVDARRLRLSSLKPMALPAGAPATAAPPVPPRGLIGTVELRPATDTTPPP